MTPTERNEAPAGGGKVLAIMQPYFLPYFGYWQLMQAADEFVVYDDVQFSKGGWINRNRMLLAGKAHMFTLPVAKGRLGQKINERTLSENWPDVREALLAKIEQAYSDAPCYAETMPLIIRICKNASDNLADFLFASIREVRDHLGIEVDLLRSSEIDAGQGLRASDRVLALCRARRSAVYVNAPGGRDLYDTDDFSQQGIALRFLEPSATTYEQFDNTFVPSLSILDVMMFNGREEIRDMLGRYRLT